MLNRLLAAGVVFVAAAAGPAFAGDAPGADWMSRDAVKAKLQDEGFSSVLLKADDGQWEGLAIRDGAIVTFAADPKTGEIRQQKPMTDDDV
ncbi:PepSY domain-containing protein [Methylocella sp.]|uniref:PepSY domain-containing protein n=1 Tax=Methylocella sp. TaxID=1978226 RepID=UPI003784F87A